MNRIFKLVFSMSLSGSMLILTLFILRPLYKNRTGRRWQYYIWLVVIGRLLLPFSPKESLSGTLADRLWQSVSQESSRLDADFDSGEDFVDDSGNDSENDFENDSGGDSPQAPDKENATADFSGSIKAFVQNKDGSSMGEKAAKEAELEKAEDLFSHLWMVWIGVAALLLMRKATIYQSYVKYIKAGRKEVSNVRLLDTLSQVGERVGVKRPVELYVNEMAPSAMLLGFFRPCIVLPCADLREEHFLYTVWHELSHYKRLDLIYKWLVQLTICVHWFNPFVWMMGRELGRACELACDEAVICRLDGDGRIAYGDTLLEALKAGVSCKNPGSAVMLSKDAKQLKERLWTIMNFKKRSKLTVFLSGALTAALLVGATTAGAAVSDAGETHATASAKKSVTSLDFLKKQEKKAEKHYQAGNLPGFGEAFYELDEKTQKTWLDKIYKDDEIAFFSVALSQLEEDCAWVDDFAKIAYRDERLNYFSVLAGYMDRGALNSWLKKAKKDKRMKYQILLLEELDMDGEAENLEKKLEQEQEKKDNAQYKEFGIAVKGKSYYYKGKLVRIFLDIRKEGSFYVLDKNPKGTIDIVVKRDADGKIKKVRRMSAAERKELFGKDEDSKKEKDSKKDEKKEKIEKEHAVWKDKVEEAISNAGGEKVTAPISLKNVKDGDYAWIGTYDLSENDKVYYKVSAKGGKQLSVGFAKPGDDHPDTTYVTVCNERQDGNLEAVCGPYIWKSPLKPGKYRLFVHAKGADLKNVEGAAVIVKKESAQLDTRIQTLAAKNVDRSAEYASFGITANGKAHYYKDSRIRIFQDMKADRSFEYSFIDRKGTVDIRLLRGKSGAVNALELIPKAQANEILKDLFGNVPSNQKTGKEKAAGKAKKTVTKAKKPLEYTDVLRCDRENLPSGLQGILENKCKGRRWYVIRTADRQYVYFNNLPRDYAFHISGKKLYVRDMGRHTGVCVLLSLGKDVDFSLYYNDRKVRFTSIDV